MEEWKGWRNPSQSFELPPNDREMPGEYKRYALVAPRGKAK